MTTGSWSVGSYVSVEDLFGAEKSWTGNNGKTETWAGGIRPKWNNYEMSHRWYRQSVGSGIHWPGPVPYYSLNDFKLYTGWSTNDDLRLLNKLAEQVRGSSFDLGVNLAEAHRTYEGILQNLKSVGSALLLLKRGNIPAALRALGSNGRTVRRGGSKTIVAKDLSQRWLETQYAFLPTLSQAYEGAKAFAAVTGPRSFKFTASHSTRATKETSPTSGYTRISTLNYSKRIIADLYEQLSDSRVLGLANPLEIVWEVVPYSFVVDWFLPIGSYISAWGVIPALSGRFMTSERGSLQSGQIFTVPPFKNTYPSHGRVDRVFRLKRTISGSLSIPRPTFNSLPKALSPRRLFSAVALIHQRLG